VGIEKQNKEQLYPVLFDLDDVYVKTKTAFNNIGMNSMASFLDGLCKTYRLNCIQKKHFSLNGSTLTAATESEWEYPIQNTFKKFVQSYVSSR
jgi:hypothetical protein